MKFHTASAILWTFFSSILYAQKKDFNPDVTGGFATGTQIMLQNSQTMAVEDIPCGSRVQTFDTYVEDYDEEDHKVTVQDKCSREIVSMHTLTFKGIDETITLAPDQKVLQFYPNEDSVWVEASELNTGDLCVSGKGSYLKLTHLTKSKQRQRAWLLELSKPDFDSFCVGESLELVVKSS